MRLPVLVSLALAPSLATQEPIEIGTRRELFVDHFLIDRLDAATLELGTIVDQGPVHRFDAPWEGRFSGYATGRPKSYRS